MATDKKKTNAHWCKNYGKYLEPQSNGGCQFGFEPHEKLLCCQKCKTCKPGKQFASNGVCDCVPCQHGTYKEAGMTKCMPSRDCELENKETLKKSRKRKNAKCGKCKQGYKNFQGNPDYACERLPDQKTSLAQSIDFTSQPSSIYPLENITGKPDAQKLHNSPAESSLKGTETLWAPLFFGSIIMFIIIIVIMTIGFIVSYFRKNHSHPNSGNSSSVPSVSTESKNERSGGQQQPEEQQLLEQYYIENPQTDNGAQPIVINQHQPNRQIQNTDANGILSYQEGDRLNSGESNNVQQSTANSASNHGSKSLPCAIQQDSTMSTNPNLSLNLTENNSSVTDSSVNGITLYSNNSQVFSSLSSENSSTVPKRTFSISESNSMTENEESTKLKQC